MLGYTPTMASPATSALVLWRSYNLNVSAWVIAQQRELLQNTLLSARHTPRHDFSMSGLFLVSCMLVSTTVILKLNFLNNKKSDQGPCR